MKWYRDCRIEIFGSDQDGKHCVVDKDCPTQRCDILSSKCLIEGESEIEKVSKMFFGVSI